MDYTQKRKIRKLADKHQVVGDALHFYADYGEAIGRLNDLVQSNENFFGYIPAGTHKLSFLVKWLEKEIVEQAEATVLLALCNCDRCRDLRGETKR